MDQCIVCLEELESVVPGDLQDANGGVASIPPPVTTTNPGKNDDHQAIALIKPCNHVLHDECLREWSQKANSCPICRQQFNLVHVLDKVGGKFPPHFLLFPQIGNCAGLCDSINRSKIPCWDTVRAEHHH